MSAESRTSRTSSSRPGFSVDPVRRLTISFSSRRDPDQNVDGSFQWTASRAAGAVGSHRRVRPYAGGAISHGTNGVRPGAVGGQPALGRPRSATACSSSCTSDVETWSVTCDTQGHEGVAICCWAARRGRPRRASRGSRRTLWLESSKQPEECRCPDRASVRAVEEIVRRSARVASILINADGSFSGMATQAGVLLGTTAQFTLHAGGALPWHDRVGGRAGRRSAARGHHVQ